MCNVIRSKAVFVVANEALQQHERVPQTRLRLCAYSEDAVLIMGVCPSQPLARTTYQSAATQNTVTARDGHLTRHSIDETLLWGTWPLCNYPRASVLERKRYYSVC